LLSALSAGLGVLFLRGLIAYLKRLLLAKTRLEQRAYA
jgi:hypothetical protein